MYKYITPILFTTVLCCNCAKGPDAEAEASNMLNNARALMIEKKFTAAKDSVLKIRTQYPTAINGRKAGILLLDSIEMFHAEDSVIHMQAALNNAQKQYEEMDFFNGEDDVNTVFVINPTIFAGQLYPVQNDAVQ